MNVSEVVLQGSHLTQVPELLKACGFEIERSTVVSAHPLETILADFTRPIVVSYIEDGATHIFDPEMTLASNDELWTGLTLTDSARAIGWMIGSTSGTLGFWDYHSGGIGREVFSVDGDVTEKGHRLPEEGDIDWSTAVSDDLLSTLRRLGIFYREMKSDVEYHVYDVMA